MRHLRCLLGLSALGGLLQAGPFCFQQADLQTVSAQEASEVAGQVGPRSPALQTPAPETPAIQTEGDCLLSSRRGLQAYYDFSAAGPTVKDLSGLGDPIDLNIADLDAVRRSPGELEVVRETLIQSIKPAKKITESVRRSGEFAIEAWIRPTQLEQEGPARIVTLSGNASARNFTLGQDHDQYNVRLRTSRTNTNGIPALDSQPKVLTTGLTHVVYTRNRAGRACVYVNGKQSREDSIPGSVTNWTPSYRLTLGNEQGQGRPWLGTFYLVAIYNRDLSATEVEQNFQSGLASRSAPRPAATEESDERAHQFETQVAPLLARHCLECHDTNTLAGGLSLRYRDEAFAGGDSGVVLVGGNAAESLLWEQIESDAMPQDRPPLSAAEKQAIRSWINAGATWSMTTIDPANYALAAHAQQTWVQRLTVAEYAETVRSAVGIDLEAEALAILPTDRRADGFSNTSARMAAPMLVY